MPPGRAHRQRIRRLPDGIPRRRARHADYVAVVIQARIRGLQAGFTALDALAHQRGGNRPETAGRPVYGIDKRPAELAFRESLHRLHVLLSEIGKYCEEGRELHRLAMMETLQ